MYHGYSLANFISFSVDLVLEKSINGTVIKDTNTFVGNSAINVLSANHSDTSFISNILYSPRSKSILLNGEFTSSNASLSNNKLLSVSVDGYNSTANNIEGMVLRIWQSETLQHPALKSLPFLNTGEWFSFGNDYISTDFSQFTSIVLSDTDFYVFSASDEKYWIWDNTRKEWSNNKAVLHITLTIMLDDAQQVFGGSSFGIMGFYSNDQGGFSNTKEFFSLNTGIKTGSVLTSYYLNSSLSIIGGRFRTNISIENVALVSKDTLFPLGDLFRWSIYSAVTTAYVNSEKKYPN